MREPVEVIDSAAAEPARPAGPVRRTGAASLPRWFRKGLALSLFNLPAALLIGGMVVAPLWYVFVLSLHRVKAGYDITWQFVGAGNYLALLSDSTFWSSLRQTIIFTLLSVGLAGGIGLAIGLLMGREFRGRNAFLALLIVPWATPFVVNALMWKWIYDPVYGSLDGLLITLHLTNHYISWLSTPTSAMNAVAFANAWKLVPFVSIIVLAQLQAIPGELWQAAAIDGAAGAQILRYITMPLIRPAVITAIIFITIWSLRTFDVVYIMTNGGPGAATSILNWLTYSQAFQNGDFGRGSALGFVLGLVTLAWTLLYVRFISVESDAHGSD